MLLFESCLFLLKIVELFIEYEIQIVNPDHVVVFIQPAVWMYARVCHRIDF